MIKIWFKAHSNSTREYYVLVPSSGPALFVKAALENAAWVVTRVEDDGQ